MHKMYVLLLALSTVIFLPLQAEATTITASPSATRKLMPSIVITPRYSTGMITNGPRANRKIAITFDADMTASMEKDLKTGIVKSWYNKDVIDELIKTETKATLFMAGMWAETYPEEARELGDNKLFEIANHSYSHPSFYGGCYGLRQTSQGEKIVELKKSQEVLETITGKKPRFFRFPGGCYSKLEERMVVVNGMRPVQWDVVGGDPFNMNVSGMVTGIMANTKGGSVIVLHMNGGPNAPKTAEVIKEVIPQLKKKGYEFVTMSELMGYKRQ